MHPKLNDPPTVVTTGSRLQLFPFQPLQLKIEPDLPQLLEPFADRIVQELGLRRLLLIGQGVHWILLHLVVHLVVDCTYMATFAPSGC